MGFVSHLDEVNLAGQKLMKAFGEVFDEILLVILLVELEHLLYFLLW